MRAWDKCSQWPATSQSSSHSIFSIECCQRKVNCVTGSATFSAPAARHSAASAGIGASPIRLQWATSRWPRVRQTCHATSAAVKVSPISSVAGAATTRNAAAAKAHARSHHASGATQ